MTRFVPGYLCLPALLFAAALVISPALAAADEPQALIVPFDGTIAAPLAEAPARLSDELEAIIAEGELKPFDAKIAREDLTAVAGCSQDTEDCMSTIAEAVGVQVVALGSVKTSADGRLEVTLTVYTVGKKLRRGTLWLDAKDIDDIVGEFGTKARAWLGSDASKDNGEPKPGPDPVTATAALPSAAESGPPSSPAFSFGRVKPYSYAIAGGGVALLGLGAILYAVSSGKQSEIDDHPTDTLEQLQALRDLESSAKNTATFGNMSTILGGIAAAAGVTLIVLQGTKKESQPRAQLVPVAMAGGFGLTLTLRGDL